VLVLYSPDGKYKVFEGSWKGLIGYEPRGSLGFGYDPIFIDTELKKTAAELIPEIKNRVSHRAQAFRKLKEKFSETAGQQLS
jgi:XTP/dITP diphosphohydrolase